jgi:hypothetical protein
VCLLLLLLAVSVQDRVEYLPTQFDCTVSAYTKVAIESCWKHLLGAGVLGPDLLQQVDGSLESIRNEETAQGCPPATVIAYGHQTLRYGDSARSVVDQPCWSCLGF